MNDHFKRCRPLICLLVVLGLTYSIPAVAEDNGSTEEEGKNHLTPPPGYTKDERGRIFQTSFDLRRRYYLGVHDMLRIYEDQELRFNGHSLLVDVGGSYEIYDSERARRHRHRFAEGRLSLAPFEIDALLYGYDVSRSSEDAPLWLTTFIGEPRRFDIPIAIGGGFSMGRLHYRRRDIGDLMVMNLGEGHISWEFYQGEELENYLLVTTGVGLGLIHHPGAGHVDLYGAPEVGLRGAWTLTDDGLTQVGIQGRMQWAWEVETGAHWRMGSLQASAEWSPLAINDQPITFFLAPEIRYSDFSVAELQGLEMRGILGLRLNLFVPPRQTESEHRK